MSVIISDVRKKSPAYKKGIRKGAVLKSINSHDIEDILDYQFYINEEKVVLEIINDKGKVKNISIKKGEDEDVGLEFETYLMDKQKRCRNGCMFCFIDQLPQGMRESLYFKDDDSRLSFLFGNYITLTNLSEHDVDRIIKMHISPVNVSVHTMNPELRVKLMKNKNAGKSLEILQRFADCEIKLNAQLVLCPGINDGKELDYSLCRLEKLYPSLQSVAVVPVGLTGHRENLCHIDEYTPESAKQVINAVDAFASDFKKKNGTRLVYCADEFYIKAQMRLPDEDYYEDYPQIENGVGLWRSLESEFYDAMQNDTSTVVPGKVISLATGEAAFPLLEKLCMDVQKKYEIKIHTYKIENDFFGRSITVAGLITGGDLLKQLEGKPLGEKLLIPAVMLRSEGDRFLDDVTLTMASEKLNTQIVPVSNDGRELLEKILA